MANKEAQNKEYNENSVRVLEGLEAVRTRPGMYIGSTNATGLHHMIWEIVDNSIDEAMAGYATTVTVVIHEDSSISVEDDGRGIPIEIHPQTNLSTVCTVLTVLHAGGKFDNSSYKVSGGLHGVGASVVNALSSSLKAWVWKKSKEYYIEFHDGGNFEHDLKEIGENKSKTNGTKIQFYPDFSIMEYNEWDEQKVINRLKELAYLNKGTKIIFKSEKSKTELEWCYKGGLIEYVEDLNTDKDKLFPQIISGEITQDVPIVIQNRDVEKKATYSIKCELAFQYTRAYSNSIHSFCNNINTVEGGTHEDGFLAAIVKVINKYAQEHKIIKNLNEKVTKDDVIEGLTAIVSIKHPNPQYEGQTKKKLGNSEVRKFVNTVTEEIFEKFLLENPTEAKVIVERSFYAAEARKKAQKVREEARRKSPFESNALPGKLADCSCRDASVTELYIVEGDSAGGSAKTGRERDFQAILPLKGKILNVQKTHYEKALTNDEISYMISAIGTGITPNCDLEKLRYNKIIIMTDADVDGAHIRILLLTFFYRYMKELITNGHIYIAQPPLYKFSQGKQITYAYSDEQLAELKKNAENGRFNVQRYKGLGEMNPEQLWETTMNPKNRVLLKVTMADAIAADKAFSLFMSDDVPPRKEYIEQNAEYVKDIDA